MELVRSVKANFDRARQINWQQVRKEFSGVAPYLVPFLKCCTIYGVLWLPEHEHPGVAPVLVKCMPVLSLISFVFFQGVSNSYNRKILAGLTLCCIGDALLVWQKFYEELFLLGMFMFAVAMCLYISALGFRPFGVKQFLLCSLLMTIFHVIFIPALLHRTVMLISVNVYILLLGVAGWRALAGVSCEGGIRWRKVYAAVGISLFIISDCILGISKFIQPIMFHRLLVMSTYYSAQLFMSLSVINSHILMDITPTPIKKQ